MKFASLKRRHKAALIAAAVFALMVLAAVAAMLMRDANQVVMNTGCSAGIPEPDGAVPLAPIGDSRADRVQDVVVYYANSDYTELVATVQQVSAGGDVTLEEAVVRAALAVPNAPGLAALGASDIQLLSLEVAQGVATVDLSIDARRLEPERLHMLRAAIVDSLIELGGIDGVNVLIDDRDEGIIQLPSGTMSWMDTDLEALWHQAREEDARCAQPGGQALERRATLYFGAPGGQHMLPEVRTLDIEGGNYLGEAIEQLLSGPDDARTHTRLLPPGVQYLREAPEIVTSAGGAKVAVVSFTGAASDYLERNGIPTALAFGSLVRTVCGFVPEVEGVICDIDGIMVSELYDASGQLMYTFDDGIMRRGDFDSLVGDMVKVYYPTRDYASLRAVDVAVSRYDVGSPRALLKLLMSAPMGQNLVRAMPDGVTDADVLGVRVERDQVLVNLSGAFYQACAGMRPERARALVYSIVNTMCSLDGIRSVRFYFDGERVDSLASTISMRGPLLSNSGIVQP